MLNTGYVLVQIGMMKSVRSIEDVLAYVFVVEFKVEWDRLAYHYILYYSNLICDCKMSGTIDDFKT